MNFKTTVALAVLLAAMVVAFAAVRSRPKPAESSMTAPVGRTGPSSAASRDLLEKKLGDVVKVALQVKGKEPWVFEKQTPAEGGTPTWRMTTPMDMPVAVWEVDKFGRELGRLQYDVSYEPGATGAISPADAGLSPPEGTVTLTDAAGETAIVEIGKPASDNSTYVRLAGKGCICVGKANLRTLWKSKPLEYRDMQLWNFAPENVTRVEVTDRTAADGPLAYAFVKDGARWMMESPAAARATNKVDEMLRSISRLRVGQWYDEGKDKLAVYGLEPAALTVRVTVEEKVSLAKDEPEEDEPEGDDEEEEKEPATQTKTSVHELHVASRSPIGEDIKVYVRAGDDTAVATVMKATTDKFKPAADWRDMHVTTANVEAATRIDLSVSGQRAAFAQKDGAWHFDGDGGRAEDSAVKELLKAVKDMSATVFVEAESPDAASFGFSAPQADIRLTVPGIDGPERITVGAYTDESVKRMVYVRRGDSTSIGKVRTPEVETLLRLPSAYRDRTVLQVPEAQIHKISLSTQNRYVGGQNTATFERDVTWTMTAPVKAAVRTDRMDKLVRSLANLRAAAIVAGDGEASAFGLNAPTATVTITQTDETATEHQFMFAAHNGKFYARRADQPSIYEIAADFYNQLFDEFRTTDVMTFEDAKVRQFSIRKGDQTHTFVKNESRWTYQAEPDLPLDAKKVDNLLLQLKDLKTERYVRNAADDLAAFGLSLPYIEVTVTLEDGTKRVLRVSQQGSDKEADKGKYAVVDDGRDVFLLTDDTLQRFEVSLPNLEKV